MLLEALLLLLPGAAAAEEAFPSCVKRTSPTTYQEPADLAALLDCHNKKLERFTSDYEVRRGDLPPETTVERWEDRQRAEVADFIRRHPGHAVIDGDPASSSPGRRSQKPVPDEAAAPRTLAQEPSPGRQALTPKLARALILRITKAQGYVSQDLQDLLEAVKEDGATLSDTTFQKMLAAAREARNEGLDLPAEVKAALLRDDEPAAPAPQP